MRTRHAKSRGFTYVEQHFGLRESFPSFDGEVLGPPASKFHCPPSRPFGQIVDIFAHKSTKNLIVGGPMALTTKFLYILKLYPEIGHGETFLQTR